MIYTGIGSRKIPENIKLLITDLGCLLGLLNYTLRSGGADGSDTAFENGCDIVDGKKEIYLPWKKFNNNKSDYYILDDNSRKIAKKYHPNWYNLKDSVKKLHTRNVYQVLGFNLDEPSKFLICWTQDGCESKKTRTIKTGGTGMAISIADDYEIPIINLNNKNYFNKLELFL